MNEETEKRDWRGITGWGLAVFGVIERIIDVSGNIDFVIERSRHPGWIGSMFELLLNNVGVLMILTGVALIVWHERRRVDQRLAVVFNASASPATIEPEPEPPNPTTGGVTLAATATVRDPTPQKQLERLLYTGMVRLSAHALESSNILEMTVAGYNASDKLLVLSNLTGNPECELPDDDGVKRRVTLPTPNLIRAIPHHQIRPWAEFHLVMNVHLSAAHAEVLRKMLVAGDAVTIDLTKLFVELSPLHESDVSARLKLWDGVNLRLGASSVRTDIVRVAAAVGSTKRGDGG